MSRTEHWARAGDYFPTNKMIDSFADETNPDTNWGSETFANCGEHGQKDSGFEEYHLLIRFDGLHTIPTDATIDSAYLWIYVCGLNGDPSGVLHRAYRVADWDEGTVTWNNKPAEQAETNAVFSGPSGTGWFSIDLCSGDDLVTDAIANRGRDLNFVVRQTAKHSSEQFFQIMTSNAFGAGAAQKPYLRVTWNMPDGSEEGWIWAQ